MSSLMHRLGALLFGAGAASTAFLVALTGILVLAGGRWFLSGIVLVDLAGVGTVFGWGTMRGLRGSPGAAIFVGAVGLVWAIVSVDFVAGGLVVPAVVAGFATAAGATLMLQVARRASLTGDA